MCQFIYQAYKYFKLYRFMSSFINLNNININNIDNLIDKIKDCGCVAIKLCQWTLPKIELMENTFSNQEKKIFKKLENFYDNCELHSINYTYTDYYKQFNRRFTDDYSIVKVIGSGSIGQVYRGKLLDGTEIAFKVKHPEIERQKKGQFWLINSVIFFQRFKLIHNLNICIFLAIFIFFL